jgi:hypothetical protein
MIGPEDDELDTAYCRGEPAVPWRSPTDAGAALPEWVEQVLRNCSGGTSGRSKQAKRTERQRVSGDGTTRRFGA